MSPGRRDGLRTAWGGGAGRTYFHSINGLFALSGKAVLESGEDREDVPHREACVKQGLEGRAGSFLIS